MASVKVGNKGVITIPKDIRDLLGLEEGTLLIVEVADGEIVLRPAVAVPKETYDMRRKAEFLLNNAADSKDYERVREEVRRMGFDPDEIEHDRPGDEPNGTAPGVP